MSRPLLADCFIDLAKGPAHRLDRGYTPLGCNPIAAFRPIDCYLYQKGDDFVNHQLLPIALIFR